MSGMVRVPLDELERMCFTQRAEIEYDREENMAVARVAGVVFYSVLGPAVNGAA